MEQNDTIVALSQAFANYVVTCYEPKAIQTLIEGRYGYLLSHERQAVQEFICTHTAKESFQSQIAEKMQAWLESETPKWIDGIIQFRLKSYVAYLTNFVDSAVQNYELQQEYTAFLLLMRNFVDKQIPLYKMIHFVVRKNDTVDLLDTQDNVIVCGCRGDALLDILLTIAPEKIEMHHSEAFVQKELLTTIQSVFSGKISICNGCGLCGKILM